MSDVLLASGPGIDLAGFAHRLAWTTTTRTWQGSLAATEWIASRTDDPVLWAPARDPQSGAIVVLNGRIAPEEVHWQRAENLPYEGGLAARLVLDRWLKAGERAVPQLGGAVQVTLIDPASSTVHLWTDCMGLVPAFALFERGFVFGSHPDVVAEVLARAGRAPAFDADTMAEFLRTGTSVHPFSYWRGVRQLDPATHYRIRVGDGSVHVISQRYWQPAWVDGPYLDDRREIAERLAEAMVGAVRRRTLPRLGSVAVLLSAGADSRTALFAADDPGRVTCYTLFDDENAELDGARRLARIAGTDHVAVRRSPDYYIEHAAEAVRLSGGMWSIDSAHYGGLLPALRTAGHGTVLTGCYADYFFKGLGFNRRARTLFGRPLPLHTVADYEHRWYQPYFGLAAPAQSAVEARLIERFAGVGTGPRAASRAEHLRLAPVSREADTSGRLQLRRSVPFDFFLSDSAVVDLYGAISPRQKASGIAFGQAVERVTGTAARTVKNNNYGTPVGAGEAGRVAHFLTASLRRKLGGQRSVHPFERDPASVATAGSWPYFPRVIALSPTLKDWWSGRDRAADELLFTLLGPERAARSLSDWANRESTLFVRYLTAALWLSQQPSALGSAVGASLDRTG